MEGLIQVLYDANDGAMHGSIASLVDDFTRDKLKLKYENGSKFRNILSAFVGLFPDIDLLSGKSLYGYSLPDYISNFLKILGPHRTITHVLPLELTYGFAIGAGYQLFKDRKLNLKNVAKSSVAMSLAAATHFVFDYIFGGSVPIWFNHMIDNPYLIQDNSFTILGKLAISGGTLAYFYRKNKKSITNGAVGEDVRLE